MFFFDKKSWQFALPALIIIASCLAMTRSESMVYFTTTFCTLTFSPLTMRIM